MTEIQKADEVKADKITSMAKAILPYYVDGTKQGDYLSYLASYFSVEESLKLADVSRRSLDRWRAEDPMFVELENKAKSEYRDELSGNLLSIEYTRNMKLVLAKDFKILYKSMDEDEHLSEFEEDYLKLIRKFYTPDQLARIQSVAGGKQAKEDEDAFDFTRTAFKIILEKEEIRRA